MGLLRRRQHREPADHLVRGLPNRSFADDAVLGAALAHIPGMSRTVHGTLDLWLLGDGSNPTVHAYGGLVQAPAAVDAGAAVIGSIDKQRAIEAAKAAPTKPGPRIVDFTPSVSSDVVSWPVPAVDVGPVSTTVTVPEGTYPTLVPTVDASGTSLVLSDPTRVLVDGKSQSARPPLHLPVSSADVVAVTAGTRTVSLDAWATPEARGNPSSTGLPVGSDTPITAWAPASTPAHLTPYSDVYDCDNYEPRPAAELGLRRVLASTPQGVVVRLSARDHAACTRVVVTNARPGTTYRVRLEFRTVTGKRPQICVWQVGTDGCDLTARPGLKGSWTRFETFVKLDRVATGLQVILQANVGQRLLPATVVDYRALAVDALKVVGQARVFPPPASSDKVVLSAGPHTLSVVGGMTGSVLSDFEPLQDCFRYDDQTPQQAGLYVQRLTGEPQPAFRMGARAHTACVGATAPTMGASSLYVLSFEAKKVALRDPKVCLYRRGPDNCLTLPVTQWTTKWQPYSTLIQPDPTAVETRLYLYGLRDLAGKSQSEVDYRAVRLTPVASTSTVVLVRDTPVVPVPAVDWSRVDPTRYPVALSGPGTVLVLRETSAPGWQAQGFPSGVQTTHTAVEGWANAWLVPPGRTQGSLVYGPARISRYALLALPIALVAAFLWILAARWLRRRGRRARRAVTEVTS